MIYLHHILNSPSIVKVFTESRYCLFLYRKLLISQKHNLEVKHSILLSLQPIYIFRQSNYYLELHLYYPIRTFSNEIRQADIYFISNKIVAFPALFFFYSSR